MQIVRLLVLSLLALAWPLWASQPGTGYPQVPERLSAQPRANWAAAGLLANDKGYSAAKEIAASGPALVGRAAVMKALDTAALAVVVAADPEIAELDLSGCTKVTGAALAGLSRLPKLVSLRLDGCTQLRDSDCQQIATLSSLSRLSLRGCTKLTDEGIRALRPLKALESLDLSGCKVSGAGLGALALSPKLAALHLKGCPLTDGGCAGIAALAALKHLTLDECDVVTDVSLLTIAKNCPALESLSLAWCSKLSDAGMAHVATLGSLTSLDVSGIRLLTATGLQALVPLRARLTSLALRAPTFEQPGNSPPIVRAKLTEDALLKLIKFSLLTKLDVAGQDLTPRILYNFGQLLPKLEWLSLAGCSGHEFHGQGMSELRPLKLRFLDVSLTVLRGTDFQWLKHFPSLEELHIRSNSRADDSTAEFISRTLTNLRVLDLHGTAVTEAALKYLGKLDRLEALDLSDCPKLSPSSWPGLGSLRRLMLDGARLSADCLAQVARCTALEELSLAGCKGVAGSGLLAIAKLDHLSTLDVSGTGVLPDAVLELCSAPSLAWLRLDAASAGEGRAFGTAASKVPRWGALRLVELVKCDALTPLQVAALRKALPDTLLLRE